MRRLKSLTLALRGDDKGAVLPMVAGMLVVLLGLSAFAVDLGWLFLNSSRLQRAADAGALAGVVHLPMSMPNATSAATTAANANGFTIGDPTTIATEQLADNRLAVTLTTQVPSFLLKVLGFDNFTVSRTATAQYVKPVPIGSPNNSFGGGSENLWASINGRWTSHLHGDPYQTRCDWSPSLGNCVDSSMTAYNNHFSGQTLQNGDIDDDNDPYNPEFRGDGYYYGIEVQENRTQLTIELRDPGFRRRNGCNTTMGDCDALTLSPLFNDWSTVLGPDTRYRLYYPDTTPLDPTDNSPVGGSCDRTYDAAWGNNEGWVTHCTISNPDPGIWVFRVSTDNGSGSNNYGVQVSTSGPGPDTPRIYGINQVSIYTNQGGSVSTLYIAEVDPIHAGKILELKFYDAGEDDASASFTMLRPDNSPAQCEWESDSGLSGGPGNCTIQTTEFSGGEWISRFNGQWLTAYVEIPGEYDCDIETQLGCWWKMSINNSQPHDRTTWEARIIGNPVRLVPNE